jgi:hypothetical protein
MNMNRKIISICIVLLGMFCVTAPLTAFAVSYQPPFRLSPDGRSVVVKGGNVHLFHSGTRDITGMVHSGDIFTVYRISSSCKMEKVGQVRFMSFVGDTYIEAEVIEGELMAGDIAKKGNISCLIISTEPCTR